MRGVVVRGVAWRSEVPLAVDLGLGLGGRWTEGGRGATCRACRGAARSGGDGRSAWATEGGEKLGDGGGVGDDRAQRHSGSAPVATLDQARALRVR